MPDQAKARTELQCLDNAPPQCEGTVIGHHTLREASWLVRSYHMRPTHLEKILVKIHVKQCPDTVSGPELNDAHVHPAARSNSQGQPYLGTVGIDSIAMPPRTSEE